MPLSQQQKSIALKLKMLQTSVNISLRRSSTDNDRRYLKLHPSKCAFAGTKEKKKWKSNAQQQHGNFLIGTTGQKLNMLA